MRRGAATTLGLTAAVVFTWDPSDTSDMDTNTVARASVHHKLLLYTYGERQIYTPMRQR
jgi:hypothetical protein